MSPTQVSAFGTFLKQHRQAAGLSQETLAERATVSVEAISTLERGTRYAPRPDTVRLLAEALRLSEQQRAALVDAAAQQRRRGPRAAPSHTEVAPSVPLTGLFPPTQALPVPLVDPIGREREIDAVTALLRGGARLLTITGPGGAGKTLLALHAANAARDAFPDGLAYLPLAALAVAHAHLLAVRDCGGQALPDAAVDDLQGKRRLLVLDNYERITAAAPLLADLCEACPGLTILALSRVALRLRGAPDIELRPLTLPNPDATHMPTAADLAQSPAVQLFVERAREVAPGFTLTDANAGTAVEICRRLDGLPLALELAAPHVKLLPLPDLLARLERQPAILADGPCDLPPRQRTMDACLDWSYDLLDPTARAVFRRLAVLAGGCMFDTAATVCAGIDAASDPAARVGDIFGHLTTLVDNNLLVMEQDGDAQRLTMPALVRAYALRQLRCSGEEDEARRQHALVLDRADAPGVKEGLKETTR